MTRPTILDLDLVVVPREATVEMECRVDHEDCTTPDAAKSAFRDMISASPYLTAWDDVRKYVEGLEEKIGFTMADASRMLRKSDVKGVCQTPTICFEFSDRVRCGPCAVKASKLAGVEIDDTHSHLPEVCRLRREVKTAEARIAELEKRLADAERVIEPFADAADLFKYSLSEGVCIDVYLRNLRAARAYMEGK